MSTQLKQYAAYLTDFALIKLRYMMLSLCYQAFHYRFVLSLSHVKFKHNRSKINGLSKSCLDSNLPISPVATWFLSCCKQNTFQPQWHSFQAANNKRMES